MKLHVYEQIVKEIELLPFEFSLCFDTIRKKFPNEKTLELKGLIIQNHQDHVKASYYPRKNLLKQYEKRVAEGKPFGIIGQLAIEKRFSAALLARFILEEWLTKEGNGTRPDKSVLREYYKEPMLIQNGRLSFEISYAFNLDVNFGPIAEFTKHSLGIDYEAKLRNHMLDLGLDFLDDNEQRVRGFDKTPDIKLEVPIAIDGCVVNWIESKALFGNQENHADYLKNQLWSYWNRFGPGMVIYWYGHIEELKHDTRHSGILVTDSFPDRNKIVFYDPNLISVKKVTVDNSN